MALTRRNIIGCSIAAFWLGAAAIVGVIVGLATLNPLLVQSCLIAILVSLAGLILLRWRAGGPLNSGWAIAATVVQLISLGLFLFFLPVFSYVNNVHLLMQSTRSLKQIAAALLDYHDKHGHLPAASTSDKGMPLLSWRVAILPSLGEEPLYRQFHLDEPWDSPHNLKLLERMPAVYRTPLLPGENSLPHHTSYQVLLGPGTAFEPGRKLRMTRDFPDGLGNTILVADAANPVPWTKPEDLVFDPEGPLPTFGGIRRDKGQFPWRGGEGSGRVNVASCDGTVKTIQLPGISESTLRDAIIRNDGRQLGSDWN